MKHTVDLNQNLHRTLLDPKNELPTRPLEEPNRLLQKADCVWSRMTLEKDEVLFVKVSLAAAEHVGAIADLIDKAFGSKRGQVLVYVDGTLELTKVKRL